MKKLVIFDCDGVLVDSEPLANHALVDCLSDLRVEMSVDEALKSFKGRKLAECLLEIEKTKNVILPGNFEKMLRDRMGDYFESKLRPISGVAEAIKGVKQLKCVASNGPLEKTKRNLEIVGLISHFGENIYSAYTIQKWKPEPDLFLHACKDMGSDPVNCIIIEDSELGIQAAVAGGFKVLAFGIQPAPNEAIKSFQDMAELPELIESIFGRSKR